MARSVRSEAGLADTKERDDEYRVWRRKPSERCGHRLLSVVPIVSIRVEGGYVGRCLLCGTTGPVSGNGEAARGVLWEQMVSDEK